MPLEYFSLPHTNREITGWVRGAGYCKFSFSSYTCSSSSIISLMYHLPWKDLPLTYWYHSQQWVNLSPSQSRKPFHLAFWIFRERFAFSGKECKRSDTTEIMICLEQSWIGTMCMSKHGNECHIVGFIQPLIQEKDFTAMVMLLVWQAIDVTENNQLAPKSETKSNNKDTQDYPLKKKRVWRPAYDLYCRRCSAHWWQVVLTFLWPLNAMWSDPFKFQCCLMSPGRLSRGLTVTLMQVNQPNKCMQKASVCILHMRQVSKPEVICWGWISATECQYFGENSHPNVSLYAQITS